MRVISGSTAVKKPSPHEPQRIRMQNDHVCPDAEKERLAAVSRGRGDPENPLGPLEGSRRRPRRVRSPRPGDARHDLYQKLVRRSRDDGAFGNHYRKPAATLANC